MIIHKQGRFAMTRILSFLAALFALASFGFAPAAAAAELEPGYLIDDFQDNTLPAAVPDAFARGPDDLTMAEYAMLDLGGQPLAPDIGVGLAHSDVTFPISTIHVDAALANTSPSSTSIDTAGAQDTLMVNSARAGPVTLTGL